MGVKLTGGGRGKKVSICKERGTCGTLKESRFSVYWGTSHPRRQTQRLGHNTTVVEQGRPSQAPAEKKERPQKEKNPLLGHMVNVEKTKNFALQSTTIQVIQC